MLSAGLLVLDQRLLIDDPSHAVRLWIKSNRRVNFDAFKICFRVADIAKPFFGWMPREDEFSGVEDDQEFVVVLHS